LSVIGSLPGNADTNVVTNPSIANFLLPLANTEYPYTFPAGTKRFTVKNRTASLIKLSYTAGQSGVTWFSIEPGVSYTENEIRASATITMYVQSPSAAQLLEIISWR
jgi:hypothetical protein